MGYHSRMQSKATTVKEYLSGLPDDRRKAISAVRAVIRKNLPSGYKEGMQCGMIGYFVPHRLYPPGYHCDPKQPLPFASLASQKNHMAIHLMCIYLDAAHASWFQKAWVAGGHKLDMGKGCVRFKSIDNVPLDVVGEAVRRVPVKTLVTQYESILNRSRTSGKRAGGKKTTSAGARKKSSGGKTKRTAK